MSTDALRTEPRNTGRLPLLFAAGFRLFFLAAGLYAALATGVWLLALEGGAAMTPGWHGHEMIFGFAVAAIAGFLLTAVPNWTGKPGPSGLPLLGLGLLWLLGRVAMLTSGFAWLDLLFLPVLAAVVGRDILAARNTRNYVVVLMVLGLAGLNALFHFGDELTALRAATFLIVALIALIGGRIIPAFTQNALRAAGDRNAACSTPALAQRLAVPSVIAVVVAQVLLPETHLSGFAALIAAAILGWGMSGWRSWATRRMPIVWILHVGYVWVPIGFLLVGLADVTDGDGYRALHALTANAIGIMVLAVASRAALGHSGRPLRVSRATVAAYLLVIAGGLIRVGGPDGGAIVVAGLLWSLGYAVFTVAYWPILTGPRLDGRPG